MWEVDGFLVLAGGKFGAALVCRRWRRCGLRMFTLVRVSLHVFSVLLLVRMPRLNRDVLGSVDLEYWKVLAVDRNKSKYLFGFLVTQR